MTNKEVLSMIRYCKLHEGIELIPKQAYLFNKAFPIRIGERLEYQQHELIVITKNNTKVDGVLRMSTYDIHIVMHPHYEGLHLMSNFLKTGIINNIWPENVVFGLWTDRHRPQTPLITESFPQAPVKIPQPSLGLAIFRMFLYNIPI